MAMVYQLIEVARRYAVAEDVRETTVSARVFNDAKKLAALIDGADIQTQRFERAMQWFSDHWPAGAVWPDDVARPEPVAATDEAAQ